MAGSGDKAGASKKKPLTEAQVTEYLLAHPDFLIRNPDIAVQLAPPTRSGDDKVADFQQFMIEKLRQDLDQMKGCAEHLINTTRSNMTTTARTHEAVLAALDAKGMAELAQVVNEDLPRLLDVDVVTLCFETGDACGGLSVPGVQRVVPGSVDAVLGGPEHDSLLRARAAGDPAIFGAGAGLVASFALVRLRCGDCPPGLLALGSREERTFHADQGTELLGFLAQVIERAAQRWLST